MKVCAGKRVIPVFLELSGNTNEDVEAALAAVPGATRMVNSDILSLASLVGTLEVVPPGCECCFQEIKINYFDSGDPDRTFVGPLLWGEIR